MTIKMNINDSIIVRLTPYGKDLAARSGLCTETEILTGKFQLWSFMNVFGTHLYNGSKQVIWDNDMELCKVTYEKD